MDALEAAITDQTCAVLVEAQARRAPILQDGPHRMRELRLAKARC